MNTVHLNQCLITLHKHWTVHLYNYCLILLYFPDELQQVPPSPVCPSDDIILTCTVTTPTNQTEKLLLYSIVALDELDRELYAGETAIIANSSTVGPFTTISVKKNDDSHVLTTTINGIMFQDVVCAGIKCKNGYSDESVVHVALG